MNTLTHDATTITLPDDLAWSDEFAWKPVTQSAAFTITGALSIEARAKQAGRPMTLEGGPNWGLMTRANCAAVMALLALPAALLTLSFRGASFDVVFDHAAGGFTATGPALWDYSDPNDTDLYTVAFRFLQA